MITNMLNKIVVKKLRRNKERLLTVALTLALIFNALALAFWVGPVSAASIIDASDTMTRHRILSASDHSIEFTTVEAINAPGDEIIVTFEAGFDFVTNGVAIADVDLEVGGVDKTLAASAANGVWGFDLTLQVMTFEAPLDAGVAEIAGGSVVEILIGTVADSGTSKTVNPGSIGSYEIAITGATWSDTGEIDVPIMDNDTVSISATVDTFITFDLDIDDSPVGAHAEDPASYSIDLQELTFGTITDEDTTSVEEIYVDIDTNADDGAIIQVRNANGATGLSSSSSGDNIPSSNTDLTINSVDGGYGLAATEHELPDDGDFFENSPFDEYLTAGGIGGLTTSFQLIFDTNDAPIVGGDGVVYVRAVAGTSTSAADDYTDTLTFRATATY